MCGIVGYIGHRQGAPVLLEGLRRLEYRGYDSAGLALVQRRRLKVHKTAGRVEDLRRLVDDAAPGTVGIAHTRWATHGEVTDVNAHPHLDTSGRFAVVHNGIVENADELRAQLIGVLHDAVVHDREPAGRVEVRVRVDVGHLAVGGPPGVRDADRARRRVIDQPPQVLDPPGRLVHFQPAALHQGQTRRVVAPVLQPAQPLQQHRSALPMTDVADDPAHVIPLAVPSYPRSSRGPAAGAGALCPCVAGAWGRVPPWRSAVHDPPQLPLGQRGRRHPPLGQLGRDRRPDRRVAMPAPVQLRVPAPDELLGSLAEVRQHVGDHPGGRLRPQPGGHDHVPDQLVMPHTVVPADRGHARCGARPDNAHGRRV